MLHLFVQVLGSEQTKEVAIDKCSTIIDILDDLNNDNFIQNLDRSSIQFVYRGNILRKYLSFAFQNIEDKSTIMICPAKRQKSTQPKLKFFSISEKYRKKLNEERSIINYIENDISMLVDCHYWNQNL